MNARAQKISQDIERIIGNSDAWTFGPVQESVILAAECELNLSFPATYRIFLQKFGAAKVFGLEIFGLPDTRDTDRDRPPTFLNVIDQTASLRGNSYGNPALPDHLIYFAVDDSGGGYSFYINTLEDKNTNDGPVLIENASSCFRRVSGSFLDFLEKMSNGEDGYFGLFRNAGVEDHIGTEGITSYQQTASSSGDTGYTSEESNVSKRLIHWLQIIPNPCPPDLSLLAQHFGIDAVTREVFVYALLAEVDLEQQMEAFAAGSGFFADPTESGGSRHPYISIDYLILNVPALLQFSIFTQLKQVVLDAYDEEELKS